MSSKFWQKVDKAGDICWNWQGSKHRDGYGWFYYEGKNHLTHVFSWFLTYGYYPKKICVLHKCDNPACVRPDHLFLGTQLENIQDRVKKNRSSGGKNGSPPRGIRNPKAKLTFQQVQQIRERYDNGETQVVLASYFKVSQNTISKIINNITRVNE